MQLPVLTTPGRQIDVHPRNSIQLLSECFKISGDSSGLYGYTGLAQSFFANKERNDNWLVVWDIFYFIPTDSNFSEVLKPPTR
jgi:hypothetical protein